MRVAHNELCFTRDEFKRLDYADICRRYSLGDAWVDAEKDREASKLVAPK